MPELIKRRRPLPRRLVLIACLAVAAAAALFLAAQTEIRGRVRKFRTERAIITARGLFEQGRTDLALLKLREIIRKYPHNPALLSEAAGILENLRDPVAIQLRRRAVEADPESIDHKIALAATLILFGRHPEAARIIAQTLSNSPPEALAPRMRRLHDLKGQCHMAFGEFQAAKAEFLEAKRLDPSDRLADFNSILAAICIGPPELDGAMSKLRGFSTDPAFTDRVAAARIEAALRHPSFARTPPERDALLAELERSAFPESFHYRVFLEALQAWRPDRVPDLLEKLISGCAMRPELLAVLLRHLDAKGASEAVRQALASADPDILNHPPLALLEADLMVAANDEAGLRKSLRRNAWPGMPVMAQTFKIWLAKETAPVRQAALSALLEKADADADALFYSAASLDRWGFKTEASVVWAALAASSGQGREIALPVAVSRLTKAGDTRHLRDLYEKLAGRRGRDPSHELKAIYLSLLVDKPDPALAERAKALRDRSPQNADAASVFALALHSIGDKEGARTALARFDEKSFTAPSSALAAAVILAETNPDAALRLLERHGAKLQLQEERKMLNYLTIRLKTLRFPNPDQVQPFSGGG